MDKSILESHELTATDKDLKTIKGSKGYKGWDKTATGYIKNGAGSKVAKYNINAQWFINSNGQIYYWDTNQTHSNNSNYYVFIKNAITSVVGRRIL